MHPGAAFVLLLSLIVAGCVTPASPTPIGPACGAECPTPTRVSPAPAGERAFSDEQPADYLIRSSVIPPVLRAGTAFHYQSSGNYDISREFTIVVASRNASGYLFAGAVKDDLTEDVLWDRDWFGPHDLQLNDATGLKLFDWPLTEGKTWEIVKGLAVTAHATPKGYHMVADPAKSKLEYDYSPEVGYLQSYHSTHLDIKLTRIDSVAAFAWYARGALVETSGGTAPVKLDVAPGFDEVLAVAGGNAGATALQPPGGAAPWTWQGSAPQRWDYARFPATPGGWVGAATPVAAATDFDYVEFGAVKWTRGTIP